MPRPSGSGAFSFLAAVFLASLAPLPTPRTSAAQELAGTWEVTWAQAVRYRDDEMEIQRWGTGLLELVSTGHDSDNPDLDIVEEMRWRGVLADGRLEGQMTMVLRGRGGDLRWRPWSAVPTGGTPRESP